MAVLTALELIEHVKSERSSLPVILASGYTHATLHVPDNVIKLEKPMGLDSMALALARSTRSSVA